MRYCMFCYNLATKEVIKMLCLPLSIVLVLLTLPALVVKADNEETCISIGQAQLHVHCWNGSDSLESALMNLSTNPLNVTITVEPGIYILQKNITLQNITDLHIVGNRLSTNSKVIVTCSPGAGLAFNHSQQIIIQGISFSKCGAEQTSTSRDFNQTNFTYLHYQVALYFQFCANITIRSVEINDSNGIGLVFMDSIGTNEILNSVFSNNVVNRPQTTPGGGGVYIEFSYCSPGDIACAKGTKTLPSEFVTDAKYTLQNCHFLNNNASAGNTNTKHIIHRNESDHFAFGRGGGLLLYFKGNASRNIVNITSCQFNGNFAEVGGGLFVNFADTSHNNTVNIESASFSSNECYKQDVLLSAYSSGGGAKCIFVSKSKENHLFIDNSNFTHNSAYWGGGLAVYSNIVKRKETSYTNTARISKCFFDSNVGRVGAAIDLFSQSFVTNLKKYSVAVNIDSSTFTNNGRRQYQYSDNSSSSTHAAVNVEQLPAVFGGSSVFNRNTGTALVVQSGYVEFGESAVVKFDSNSGRTGGAIALINTAWIVVYNHTQLWFDNNSATENGGAIYADQNQEHFAAYSYTCFIRYFNHSIAPKEWDVTFNFSNNTVQGKLKNAIFASSILPCVWPSNMTSKVGNDIQETFHWNNTSWIYENESTYEIMTLAAQFEKCEGYHMSVYPGLPTDLNITVFDDLGHNVTNKTVFTTTAVEGKAQVGLEYIDTSSHAIIVHGRPGTHVKVSLETTDKRAIYTLLNIDISECPPGMAYSNEMKACTCYSTSKTYIQCSQLNSYYQTVIFVGQCISNSPHGKHKDKRAVVVTHCPFTAGLMASDEPYIPLPPNISKLDTFCKKFNRIGKLCGKCQEDYGVAVFSTTYDCIPCDSNTYKKWLQYLGVILVPPTILFLIVIVFHVGITHAPANGYIFFSQVLTVPVQVLILESGWKLALKNQKHTSHILTNLLLDPYYIWSLDYSRIFYVRVCLSKSLRSIDVLALEYVSAVYPLIFLVIIYIVIELHARNCRPLVLLWRLCCLPCVRFRKNWQAKTSLIDAFATFIVLSYSKFIRVSISILTPSSVYDDSGTTIGHVVSYDPTIRYFHREHLPYIVLATTILATFGAIPPLLLLLYPLKKFQKCLNCCMRRSHALHTFVDAFQGCYKDGREGGPDRRYFAGLYFVFRIIIFIIYLVQLDSYPVLYTLLTATFVIFMLSVLILRPYKNNFYNCLDGFFFALSAIISMTIFFIISTTLSTKHIPKHVFYLNSALSFIPQIYIFGYLFYWSVVKSRWFQTHCIHRFRRNRSDSTDEDHVRTPLLSHSLITYSDCEIPDRVENPQRYEDLSHEENYSGATNWASDNTRTHSAGGILKYGTAATY